MKMKIKSFAIFLSGIALSVGAVISGGLIASSMTTNQTKASVQSGWARVTSVSDITSGGTFIIGYEATANSDVIVPMRNDGFSAAVTSNGYVYSGATVGSSTSVTINMGSVADTSLYEVAITASSTTTARLWVEQIVITAQKASTCALDYGTHFLTCTSGECLTGNVSSATWANLQSIYANADTSIQDLIKAASANQSGTDLEHAIARYGVIVEKYGYTDFLALGYSSVGSIQFNSSSNYIFMILISGTALLGGASFVYFFLKKKKHN